MQAGLRAGESLTGLDELLGGSDGALSLMRQAAAALECGPMFITVIGGCDAWTLTQSVEFFGEAMEISKALGVRMSFETHRSRCLFNPWTTREILLQLPAMELTCDFSHWCVVCERLIDTEPEIIALCAERAHHIHARVGYDQGPPRGPTSADPSAAGKHSLAPVQERSCRR